MPRPPAYHASVLKRRLQIRLDDERYGRVAARARERNTSVAAVVREVIDAALPAVHRLRLDPPRAQGNDLSRPGS